MNAPAERLNPTQLANILRHRIAEIDAEVAAADRVAAVQSEYAKRLGEPVPVAPRIRLVRYA